MPRDNFFARYRQRREQWLKTVTPVKRSRAEACRYESDSEEEPVAKRTRLCDGLDEDPRPFEDHVEPLQPTVVEGVPDCFFEGSSYYDDFPWDDASNASIAEPISDVELFISDLPAILNRRVQESPRKEEPLRVRLLAKVMRRRILARNLTDYELVELLTQRPLHPSSSSSEATTPESTPEPEDLYCHWDRDWEYEQEDSSAPLSRPPSPAPASDSGSESESESDSGPDTDSTSESENPDIRFDPLSDEELELLGIYVQGE